MNTYIITKAKYTVIGGRIKYWYKLPHMEMNGESFLTNNEQSIFDEFNESGECYIIIDFNGVYDIKGFYKTKDEAVKRLNDMLKVG